MSLEILRNVKDGSMREIETNSDEYAELINEVYDHEGSARPKWEITGRHHMQRLDENDTQEADHGYEHKPVPPVIADFETVGPELHPERALTPGEVDSGITSYEEKMESVNAARASVGTLGTLGQSVGKPVESLDKAPPEERHETGPANAGRQTRRRSSRKANAEKTPAGAGASSGPSGSSGPGGSTGSSGSSGSGS